MKEISDFYFFAQSFSLHRLLLSVYGTAVSKSFQKHDQCSHLGKAIDALIIVITFDTLLIKSMQIALLTFNDRIVDTEFFADLFFSDVVKRTKPHRYVICWGLFSLFLEHFDVKNYYINYYTAPKNPRSVICLDIFLYCLGTNGCHRTSALYRFQQSIGPRCNGAAVYWLSRSGQTFAGQTFAGPEQMEQSDQGLHYLLFHLHLLDALLDCKSKLTILR